jgi:hypothetical protein
MHSQWEDITPARANEELKTARCGRSPSMGVIDRYARDMENGRWAESPEPVVYDGEDTGIVTLRDGQQRFYALIKAALALAASGKIAHPDDFSLRLWVTRGTTGEIDKAFPYLNIGKNRTPQDYLNMEGYSNATLLYTVARRIVLWEVGHPTGSNYKPTRPEVLETLWPREGFDEAAEEARVGRIIAAAAFAGGWKVKPPVPAPGTAGLLWWLLGRAREHDRDVFMEALRTGGGLPDLDEYPADGPLHPVLMLRNRLHGDYYASGKRGSKMRQEAVLLLCLRAWEAWRRKEHTTKLQMPTKLNDKSFRDPR